MTIKTEEILYDQIAEEIERNEIHKGLWTKAFSESVGDKDLTRARYITLRVQALKEDARRKAKERTFKKIERLFF